MNKNEVREKGIVRSISLKPKHESRWNVRIERISEDSCSACSIRAICNIENQIEISVDSDTKYEIGEIVYIIVNPMNRIFVSFIVFIVPVLLFFIIYFIASALLHFPESISIGVSFFSFLISFLILKCANNKFEKKNHVLIEKCVDGD